MPKNILRRYLPSPHKVRENPSLRPLAGFLQRTDLWHLNRRSVAGAAFIGLFCAFLPIPFQMLLAAALAVLSRCNLPIAIALVWVTNPITIGPIFYFTYRLGAWLLDSQVAVSDYQLSFAWLMDNFQQIRFPLFLGSLVCAWVAGVSAFVLVRVIWRFHVVQRWRERREARKQRRETN